MKRLVPICIVLIGALLLMAAHTESVAAPKVYLKVVGKSMNQLRGVTTTWQYNSGLVTAGKGTRVFLYADTTGSEDTTVTSWTWTMTAHQALVIAAMQLRAYAQAVLEDWNDILTWVMPNFHVYGNMAMNFSFVARWPMAVVPNPRDIDDLVKTIQKVRPSCLHGVPTLYVALLNHPAVKAGKVDFKSMKLCWSAAAPLMAETKHRFESLTGCWLLEAYAMTETMLAAVCCPVHGQYKEGSVGVPLPDVDLRIVDVESGEQTLPMGQVGEISIQAPQIMVGYWEHPTETSNMIRDGWVYTGDLGYLDEDGYLFIVDRKKDLIKPGGFQVCPREVEEIIATHPAVAEVAVDSVH